MTSIASDWLTTADGQRTLLKEAQAVPANATPAVGTLTDPTFARRARMSDVASELEAHILDQGEPVSLSALERAISRNEVLPRLKARLAQASLTLRGFLRLHNNRFRVERGRVSVINEPPQEPSAGEPAVPEVPAGPLMRFLDASRARAGL